MLAGQRELEGPFGEFPGYYSGCHRYPVIEIDRVSHRKDPIYDAVYVGRPWTEIDYLQAMTTSAPIYAQVSADFPEVSAVNALYTHGLVVVISTKTRYGGFAKAVGLRVLATTHGLGYAKLVIVVDDNVDPFDLKQVMWGIFRQGKPRPRRHDPPEPLGEPPRSRRPADRGSDQDDHRCDDTDRARHTRRLRPGARHATAHQSMAHAPGLADQGPPMSHLDLDVTPRMCPRCRSTTIHTRATSPVAGVWILFACSTCLYILAVHRARGEPGSRKIPETVSAGPPGTSAWTNPELWRHPGRSRRVS